MATYWALRDYAKAIGYVAIEWNHLESMVNKIGAAYLNCDFEAATVIFNELGNVQKSSVILYLVKRFETSKSFSDHILHLIRMFNILRENRNIIQHSVPISDTEGEYMDAIIKLDRECRPLPFLATAEELELMQAHLVVAKDYAHRLLIVKRMLHSEREHFALFDKPALPSKINPFPLD